jgi:hypothetical protein
LSRIGTRFLAAMVNFGEAMLGGPAGQPPFSEKAKRFMEVDAVMVAGCERQWRM